MYFFVWRLPEICKLSMCDFEIASRNLQIPQGAQHQR